MRLLQFLANRKIHVPCRQAIDASIVVFAFLLLLVSRGAMQLVFSKGKVMVLHLACVGGGVAVLGAMAQRKIKVNTSWFIWSSLIFIMSVAASVGLTTVKTGYEYWSVYVIFTGFLLFVFLVAVLLSQSQFTYIPIHRLVLWVGWLLFLVSCVEQLRLVILPGNSKFFMFVRSASLTGSFLHYPLLMSLFSFICLEWARSSGSKLYLASGLIFSLSTIMVVSRSGMFIVFLSYLFYFCYCLIYSWRQALIMFSVAFAFLSSLLLAFLQLKTGVARMLAVRLFTSTSSQSAGNDVRVQIWQRIWDAWSSSNLLIGEYAGMVTNANQFGSRSMFTIAESSILQQLMNFGLLGMLSFYGLLFFLYTRIQKEHILLRFSYIAGVLQTSFYQSIEVVPFIVLLAFIPWFSLIMKERIDNSLDNALINK